MIKAIRFVIIQSLLIVNLFGAVHAADELVVDESGNVGIGTNTPTSRLYVQTSSGNSELHINTADPAGHPIIRLLKQGTAKWGWLGEYPTSGMASFYSYDSGRNTIVMGNDGRVGIGTTTPRSLLHLAETGNQSTSFTGSLPGCLSLWGGQYVSDGYTNLDFSFQGTAGVVGRIGVRNNGSGSYLTFGTSNNYGIGITNEAMVINPSANIGIGTTNPRSRLHLDSDGVQSMSFTGNTPGSLTIWGGSYAVDGYTNLDFSNNTVGQAIGRIGIRNNNGGSYLTFGTSNQYANGITNEALVINPSGFVGIGKKNPQAMLDVNGVILSNGTPCNSDIRWKENVKTIDDSLDRISQLRGVTYEWIDKSRGEGMQLGVIAQEVEDIFPEVVHTDSQGYKSVEYNKLVAPLIEAVKALQTENQDLRNENRRLIERVELQREKFEERLSAIEVMLSSIDPNMKMKR